MNHTSKLLLLTTCLSGALFAAVPQLESPVVTMPRTTTLSYMRKAELTRLSDDAIVAEESRLKSKRRKRLVQAGVGSVVFVATLCGLVKLDSMVRSNDASLQGKAKDALEEMKLRRDLSNSWIKKIFLGSIAAGGAALVVTNCQRIFQLVFGSVEDVMVTLFRGYGAWFAAEEEAIKGTMFELREALHGARAQQMGKEGQLYPGHDSSGEQVTYYRSDIITQYEYLVWRLKTLIALMYLIAPKKNHAALTASADEVMAYFDGFATQLEGDLNTKTRGFVTHYSHDTMQMLHGVMECIKEFIVTFTVKLRR